MKLEISADLARISRTSYGADRKFHTDSVFVIIFGLIAGILVSSFFSVTPISGLLALLTSLTVLAAEKIWSGHVDREVLLLSIFIMSFGLGILRYEIKDFHEPAKLLLVGIVVSEPEERENTTRFVFRDDSGEKVLVNTDLYSLVEYGDRVAITGRPEKPGVIVDEEDFRAFDYGQYLSRDDIYQVMSFTKVQVVSKNHGHPITAILLKIKKSFTDNIKEILAEPYASLLSGLIVSGKDAMPKEILDEFRRAGIIHIVVLSGYNITIIAEFIRRLFQTLFLTIGVRTVSRYAAIFSILAIVMFVLMTGAEATVVRAAIMVLLVIFAKMFGKRYSAPRALLFAGAIMLLENPKILVFDASFQLSFIATLGLIYVAPVLEKYFSMVPEKLGLRMIAATTLATQAAVLPLIIYSMGNFSLVSLPANILVLLAVPITMFVGFLAAILAYISGILALPLAYISHLFLSWILWVSGFLGNLPFAALKVSPFSWWLVALIYLCLFTFLWRLRSSSQRSAN